MRKQRSTSDKIHRFNELIRQKLKHKAHSRTRTEIEKRHLFQKPQKNVHLKFLIIVSRGKGPYCSRSLMEKFPLEIFVYLT